MGYLLSYSFKLSFVFKSQSFPRVVWWLSRMKDLYGQGALKKGSMDTLLKLDMEPKHKCSMEASFGVNPFWGLPGSFVGE